MGNVGKIIVVDWERRWSKLLDGSEPENHASYTVPGCEPGRHVNLEDANLGAGKYVRD
jgi:hypothetical protein